MSFLGDYVLAQGTWAGAGGAAAKQLFVLAQAGYVRVAMAGNRAVRLVRTNKPASGLSAEEQFLLRAVFGAAKSVVLDRPHQRPVAQSAITIARARLAEEGFIRRLSPRALQRRLYWGYLLVAVATAVYAGAAIEPMAGFFVPFVAVLVWVPYNVSVRYALRGRTILYRRKGRKVRRKLAATEPKVTATSAHAVEIMAQALNQRFAGSKGYYRDIELWYEGLRGAQEQFAEFGDAVRSNAVSYDGSIDSGGDSGGEGDGGDGGDGGGDG